ncbi:kinase-like domain-containing protein [Rhizophagus irregularis DAOM 181602=DAOM 197198]|nr:kinase-like domain-containing protein [Rhizophagus irregularis DAOM 181602=DAOM 197198]
MTDIREDHVVWTAYNRAYTLDYTNCNNLDEEHELRIQTTLIDESLTEDEKSEVIKLLNKDYDWVNIRGYSEIYTAIWIGGSYEEWDSKENQLTRFGDQCVILKELENVESVNKRWFEESKSHLTISSKWADVVQCYGLTKDPSSGNYMLVMNKMEMDLRTYLKQNHNKLMWKERMQIAYNIICWNADSTKRPDADTLFGEIRNLLLKFQNNQDESRKQIISNQHQQLSNYYLSNSSDLMSKNCTSKIYQFENFPEPKNATEEEQEVFHSKLYRFNIPNNIEDINNSSNEKNINTKSNSVYKALGRLEINSNYEIQNDHKKENKQQTKKHSLDTNDDDDIYNNPNFHSENQDFEISGNVSKKIRTS